MNLAQRVLGRLASVFPSNAVFKLNQGPLCSFTFDDCPRSSMTIGGQILERANAAGTFYVSASMTVAGESDSMLTGSDLARLVERGHEIGCHTYTHTSVVGQSAKSLAEDINRNFKELSNHVDLEELESFSYPFGEVSFGAKRFFSRRFVSSRGVREGLNRLVIDLSELRACPIYDVNFSLDRIHKLVAQCKKKSAWLVFYTHDVSPKPSRWGCTPEQFSEAVQAVKQSGIEILPIRDAAQRVRAR